MTMAAGARMWESEMFTKDQLVLWENKPTANQTWQVLQDYFMEKWLECHQYLQATAKHSRFKDAVLAAQEQVAAKEEGKLSAMMFALLQKQHKTQLKAMGTANQKGNGSNVRMNKRHCRCRMQGGGQGEHAARNRQHGQKHRQDKEEQKKVPPLRKVRVPQALRLLQAQGQHK